MKIFFSLLALLALFLFLCFSPYDQVERVRAIREKNSKDPGDFLHLAVVWPGRDGELSGDDVASGDDEALGCDVALGGEGLLGDDGLFFEGARMAVTHINKGGGISFKDEQGRERKIKICLHEYDEKKDPDGIARKIASNPDILSVIGYSDPDLAVRASVTFLDHRIMFIAPAVSDLQLTLHGFRNVIQTTPNDEQISREMVKFALKRGWLKAALLNVRNTYGLTYAKFIKENAERFYVKGVDENGTNTVSSLSLTFQGRYAAEDEQFYTLIARLLENEFDLVIIADSLIGDSKDRTSALIKQLREMGMKKPILGTEELHFTTLTDELGEETGAIFAASPVDLTKTVDYSNASAFSSSDFFDVKVVLDRLKHAKRPIDAWIYSRLPLNVILEIVGDSYLSTNSTRLQQSLIELFNQIVGGPSIYDTVLIQELMLSFETKALLEDDGSSGKPILLNRLVLEDAYRQKALMNLDPDEAANPVSSEAENLVPFETKRFKLGFEAIFGKAARVQSAQAYEAVYLLAQAIDRSNSIMPIKMATMFASTDSWDGLEGKEAYHFRVNGSILGKDVTVHELKDGDFQKPKFDGKIPEVESKKLYENLDADQEER